MPASFPFSRLLGNLIDSGAGDTFKYPSHSVSSVVAVSQIFTVHISFTNVQHIKIWPHMPWDLNHMANNHWLKLNRLSPPDLPLPLPPQFIFPRGGSQNNPYPQCSTYAYLDNWEWVQCSEAIDLQSFTWQQPTPHHLCTLIPVLNIPVLNKEWTCVCVCVE